MFIPLSLLGNGSVRTLPRHEYTRNNRRILGSVVFYARRIKGKSAHKIPEPEIIKYSSTIVDIGTTWR
jgi:hypothetical protein